MLKCELKKKIDKFDLHADFSVGNGELLAILGPSGCGKSTLLNCIAGFNTIDSGYIEVDKRIYFSSDDNRILPINERKIAYIQQGKILFPHLSVKENILYSVPKRKRKNIQSKYEDLLKLLDMKAYENRMPSKLSGGQQQRVAIARALMMSPQLILWDEPFSALDHMIKEDLRQLVISLKKDLNIPMIFVTHDLEEAYQLSDRMGVMVDGELLQIDDRERLFSSPKNKVVGEILGISNIFDASYSQELSKTENGSLVVFEKDGIELRGLDIEGKLSNLPRGSKVNIGIRPEQILYVREEDEIPNDQMFSGNVFEATILSIAKHLESYRLKVSLKGFREPFSMDIPRGIIQRYDLYEGAMIKVLLKYKSILIMDVLDEVSEEDIEMIEVEDQIDDVLKSIERYKWMKRNKGPVAIGISGVSNSGKTTVMTKIIGLLSDRGYSVATIKHDGHGFEMDHEGKDTYLHGKAGAKSVTIASREQYATIRKTESQSVCLDQLIDDQKDMDVVLVEGYKFSDLPKFEVIRKARSDKGVCRENTILGRITDINFSKVEIPSFGFDEIERVAEVIEVIMKEGAYEG